METGAIPVAELPGGINLTETLESGQTYIWTRSDGDMYNETPPADSWYETAVDGEALRVRQRDGVLEWQGTTDVVPLLRQLLGLTDNLPAILDTAPGEPVIQDAIEHGSGLRIVGDPPFSTLVAFICSAQMRVPRIHGMVTRMKRTYGTPITIGDRTVYQFPEPAALAAAGEDELRALQLGYRAPYVAKTAAMVANGTDPATARDLSYEAARRQLTEFVGVGNKVADCVLLFSLGFLEAVPLDTWIRTAIEEEFPACDKGSYAATSRAIREQFGGEYAGYVQTYVFHYLRQQ